MSRKPVSPGTSVGSETSPLLSSPLPDYGDRHYDVLKLGVPRSQWTRVEGEAKCGCLWTLDLMVEAGQPTFRQMFDMFGARFTFGSHTEKHADLCEQALPPNIWETTKVLYGTSVSDILRQQP